MRRQTFSLCFMAILERTKRSLAVGSAKQVAATRKTGIQRQTAKFRYTCPGAINIQYNQYTMLDWLLVEVGSVPTEELCYTKDRKKRAARDRHEVFCGWNRTRQRNCSPQSRSSARGISYVPQHIQPGRAACMVAMHTRLCRSTATRDRVGQNCGACSSNHDAREPALAARHTTCMIMLAKQCARIHVDVRMQRRPRDLGPALAPVESAEVSSRLRKAAWGTQLAYPPGYGEPI